MKKSDFNSIFRQHVRNNLSPTTTERDFVSKIYDSVQNVLGADNSIRIGSYPRFTSVRPLHDLDILYVIGQGNPSHINPSSVLNSLDQKLRREYRNPTSFTLEISRQTHSITLSFKDGEKEVFGVDVVPAYSYGKNSFNADTYLVPEILLKNHAKRAEYYRGIAAGSGDMVWIKTDPRGYIEVSRRLNEANEDFRKAVKFIKAWRSECKKVNDDFKLKSFHIEQVITGYFINNPRMEIYDAVFKFFCSIPKIIENPQIADRADGTKFIDEYIRGLNPSQKAFIIEARDFFLKKLEDFLLGGSVAELLKAGTHKRKSSAESYLFDFDIPMLTEEEFSIHGYVEPRAGGFRPRVLDSTGAIDIDRKIDFQIAGVAPSADLFKWKVKNDDSSPQPRGEINDHSTLHNPEHTKYNGNHFIECYAIKGGVCVARARQNVSLKLLYPPR